MRNHFLLQGIFLTQVLYPHFLHYRRSPILQVDSLPTEPPGMPQMYNNKVFFRNFNNIICLAKIYIHIHIYIYIAIKLKNDLSTSETWFHAALNNKKNVCYHHLLCIHAAFIYSLNNCWSKFLLHARHPSQCWACESDWGRQEFWLQKHGNHKVNTTIMDFHWVTQELEKTLGWRWKGGTHCRTCEQRRPCGSWRV